MGALSRKGERVPSLLSLMREDMHAALERDPAATSLSDILFFSTGTHIVWAYRKHHWLWTHGHHKLALLLAKRTRNRLAADIHPAATIGRRFTIDHGVGVVIGGTAILGDDCMIYQGVTLGMTGKHGGKRHPTLEDGVLVGANATVLGNITIGSGARIGAGSVVVKDVPNDVTVVGNPAHIVRDRRYKGPQLVNGGLAEAGHGKATPTRGGQVRMRGGATSRAQELERELDGLEEENVRWSCAL